MDRNCKLIMKKVLVIIIMFNIVSCNFFGSVDSSIQTNNVDFDKSDIIGTWKLDKFSYKYLSVKENFDSIYITFKSDSTFEINNSKELFNRKSQDSLVVLDKFSDGKIDNTLTNGQWKISHIKMPDYNIIKLNLIYDNNSALSDLKVYKKGEDYQIWYYFGDPDTGERLRFLKTDNH